MRFLTPFIVVSLSVLSLPAASTIVVDPAGGGDFTSIQPALDAAKDGDVVLVRPGEYLLLEPLDFNRLHVPGDPASEPFKELTLRAETGPAETILRMSPEPADPARESVLVFQSGEGPASAVEGFTLTGGRGIRSDVFGGGGAICFSGSSPTIAGCSIVGNTGYIGGGLLCADASSPALTDCTISGNRADTWGGGLACRWEGCSPTLTGCVISGNSAGYQGGALYSAGSPTLVHCTVAGNSAGIAGGGITGRATLDSTIVWGNPGGAIDVYDPEYLVASYSDIEGSTPWAGTGNIAEDPLFCGWLRPEVHVDASFAGAGDGSAARPYRTLAEALQYNLTLSGASPCWGAGSGGTAIGAEVRTEPCTGPTVETRVVRIAAGTYDAAVLTLAWKASLTGAGEARTVIEGGLVGARTGTVIEDLTACSGFLAGAAVPAGESPEIRRATFRGNSGRGGLWIGVDSAAAVADCTIRENSEGGVYACSSRSTFTGCQISGNGGNGIYCSAASPILERCRIEDNLWNGVSCPGASPILRSCTIVGNSYTALWCDDDAFPILDHCTIAGNGEGIGCDDAACPVLTSCIVWDDVRPWIPGDDEDSDAAAVDPTTWLKASHSCIRGDPVWPGEGNTNADPLFCGWGSLSVAHVDSSKPGPGDGSSEAPFPDLRQALEYSWGLSSGSPCAGTGEGGTDMGAMPVSCAAPGGAERLARVAAGTYSIQGGIIPRGASIAGAGQELTVIEGTVAGLRTGATLSDVTVTRGLGSGIVVGPGESPRIERCTVKGNAAAHADSGAGIFCGGTSSPVIVGCTISGNAGPISGGGIYAVNASPVLEDCVISGNWAGRFGGGLCLVDGSPVLRNCEIWGNATGLEGGGIYCENAAPQLLHCTVSGNSGNGLACAPTCRAVVSASILLDGEGPPDCPAALHSLLEGDPLFADAGEFDFSRFRTETIDGLECLLPDFVVRRPDLRLLAGSPAIDVAPCDGAPPQDIEGIPRPTGAGCDAGAHEFEGVGPRPFIRGETNGDGTVDLSDMIFVLAHLFLGGTPPACLEAADINDDADVDLSDPIAGLGCLFLGDPPPPPPWEACGMDLTPDLLGCISSPNCR